MARFSKRKLKAYRKQYYSSNTKKALQLKSLNYKCNADVRKDSDRESYHSKPVSKRRIMRRYISTIKAARNDPYASNPIPQKKAVRQRYISNPSPKRKAVRQRYTSNPSPKRKAVRQRYTSNPSPKRKAVRQRYTSNPSPKRKAVRQRYISNPSPKRIAVKRWYASNSDYKKRAAKMRYLRHRSAILLGRRRHYYASVLCARLRRHALHCYQDNKKSKAYWEKNVEKISTARKARYFLTEPKTNQKELYVQNLKKSIASQSALRKKLLRAFKGSRQPLAAKINESKLTKAVLNIASRKLLHNVLKLRKQSAGELLKCIRSVNALTMTATDFGESHHTASSEPFFYDQSYRLVKHTSPIVVDDSGRCVIAEEVGQRDSKTERPLKWKCTAECKLPTSNEAQCIVAVKALFEA